MSDKTGADNRSKTKPEPKCTRCVSFGPKYHHNDESITGNSEACMVQSEQKVTIGLHDRYGKRYKQTTDSTADDSTFFENPKVAPDFVGRTKKASFVSSPDDFHADEEVSHSSSPGIRTRPPSKWALKRMQSTKKEKVGFSERTQRECTFIVIAGLGLSFNSGYINGCCLSGMLLPDGMGIHQSVAAFTGTYTKSGLALASGDTSLFGFELSMVLSFIAGSCISGMMNPKGTPYRLGPSYGPAFLVGSFLLIIASVLAFVFPAGKGLFYFAAAANGLQNGVSSMYSGNLIRTTHLTGTSTDLGLIVGQVMRGNRDNLWKFWILLGLAISFWLGGFISFYATSAFRGYSLIFNAGLFLLIGVGLLVFLVITEHISVWQAASGMWHWEKALKNLSLSHSDSGDLIASEELLVELFDAIDRNGSGFIGEKDLVEALSSAGFKAKKQTISSMVRVADIDNDGLISREEWKQLVLATSRKGFRSSLKSLERKVLRRESV